MEKTRAVAYMTYKIRTMDRVELLQQIDHTPISNTDHQFLIDVIGGLSYKELAEKYCKSPSRIYQWKRTLFERLTQFDMRNSMR